MIKKILITIIVITVGCHVLSKFSYNILLRENKSKALVNHPYLFIKNKGKPIIEKGIPI